MNPLPHGGRLIEASLAYPEAERPWLDLSTGINPEAYPFTPPPIEAWHRLPEPEQLQALEAAAATAYGVRDAAMVVAAPGTQALIHLLPRLFPQQRIGIIDRTYAEHAAAWRASGTEVVAGQADALVFCNPNNPDGARHTPQALLDRARALRLLVVDEAFVDFVPSLSLAPLLPIPRVIVLRSFGKAYGLAGLRLGFALAEPGIAEQIRAALGPWPLSGLAIAIGIQALSDTGWRARAATTAREASDRLDMVLEQTGMRIVGGTTLFRTAETLNAAAVADRLARAGILVRRFGYAPDWLRFGLPPHLNGWLRLENALR